LKNNGIGETACFDEVGAKQTLLGSPKGSKLNLTRRKSLKVKFSCCSVARYSRPRFGDEEVVGSILATPTSNYY